MEGMMFVVSLTAIAAAPFQDAARFQAASDVVCRRLAESRASSGRSCFGVAAAARLTRLACAEPSSAVPSRTRGNTPSQLEIAARAACAVLTLPKPSSRFFALKMMRHIGRYVPMGFCIPAGRDRPPRKLIFRGD
jgi:hypothetical protein